MTKATVKKKTRRLKKRIRQTFGTLFLISALIIAAIPVDNLQAQGEVPNVTLDSSKSNIPIVDQNETIYTTGDGLFQFAYVKPSAASADKVAVILGYSRAYLEGGNLEIPDTVDAYLKYSDNLGSNIGYVAVGKAGNFLYYKIDEPKRDEFGNIIYIEKDVPRVDKDGKPVIGSDGNQIIDKVPVEVTEPKFYPCYYQDIAKWGNLTLEQFYYKPNESVSGNNPNDYSLTTTSAVQRIQAATVVYIGNQYLKSVEDGKWVIGGTITNSEQGVFARTTNINTLKVGKSLSGIGNFAFYGCGGLSSISLGNGLNTLGNSAFENCINIQNITLDLYSNLEYIGSRVFYNCQALKSLTMPIAVREVGDSAFENCFSLEEMVLSGKDYNVALNKLGNNVFKNCSSLKYLKFPPNFTQDSTGKLDIGILEGCTSLEYVTVPHKSLTFKDGTFTVAKFKEMVKQEFFFEGLAESEIYKTASANSFAFRYLDQDIYEIIITDSNGNKAIYRVNSKNQLISCDIGEGMEDVKLPSAIGPYHIVEISSDSFQNNCYLKKITIPSSVTKIAAGAFKGCHNLKNVIYLEPVSIEAIESKAFQTQDVAFHRDKCEYANANGENKPLPLDPVLTFTGPIGYDCVPFEYAMNEANKINVGSQVKSYIKYFSGWPTNLVVQYNDGKVDGQESKEGKNELIDYPTFSGLSSYSKEDYPYMTDDYIKAAQDAKQNYLDGKALTDYEQDIIDSALSIVLPQGVETIKEGLFRENEVDDKAITTKKIEKSLTTNSISEIAANSFEDFTTLKEVYILGETTAIGDYAFKGCTNLKKAEISATVSSLGKRPFAGCSVLPTVEFQGGPFFTCDNSIIYGLKDGAKNSVIQCLEARGATTGSTTIEAKELEGITELREEAFMGCEGLGSVDLKNSNIDKVPVNAFAQTKGLYSVFLPKTCRSIATGAFRDSRLSYIEIPSSVSYIDPDAFDTNKNNPENCKNITFYCEDNSNAAIYADNYTNITTTSKPLEVFYDVYFWDDAGKLLDKQSVPAGGDAEPPTPPELEGFTFREWIPDYHGVSRNLDVTAKYDPNDPEANKFTVKFVDFDDKVLKEDKVAPGGKAVPPSDPVREGHIFTGWRPSIENIQENTTVYAQYDKKEETELTVRFIDYNDTVLYTQKVKYGGNAIEPKIPVREGYTFSRWWPAINNITKDTDTVAIYDKNTGTDGGGTGGGGTGGGGTGGGGTGGGGTGGGTTSKLYTLTVKNGSGSGSYVAGAQVIIIANDPATGQEFSDWTVDPGTVAVASKNVTATVLTMPEGAATVTANYKTKGTTSTTGSSNSSTNGSNGGNNGNGSSGGGSSGTVNKPGSGGTTVVIDKNGLSNTSVISGTVNGSSDDFVIKITESAEATEQVVKALMNEYGDLSNIKYFPMDISLYDSTGKTKITDTTGLSISITLPIPDDLITYAGNNKAAGVVNEKLDKLTPKFSTISGVSCITFTATHFSPYVIYVDTGNLSAGVNPDETPKTGDGIHPKWFLSMGMACVSMVLFMKRDKKKGRKKLVTA